MGAETGEVLHSGAQQRGEALEPMVFDACDPSDPARRLGGVGAGFRARA
ncbi:MAG: hypothetical protein OXB92_06205 [Acidimicrobiaceae bacterium]|nr:hypothetical protein [Acidimicrobiaceae bacterium]